MPIAVVTGASRGVGRGVAIALAKSGYKVYGTGRSILAADLPAEIVRLQCDHLRDDETAAAFARVAAESGPIDVLVNSAWGGYETMVENGVFTWAAPFWGNAARRWTAMMDAGVRAAYLASAHAAPPMVQRGAGLIVNISYWAAQKHMGNAIYGVSKAATDKLTAEMAHDLRPHGVTAIALYPGLVRTEAVLQAATAGFLNLANSESPEFIGRVIAALAASPALSKRSGQVIVAATAARELGVIDVDGRSPEPLTIETA